MKIPTYAIILIIVATASTVGSAAALVVHGENTRINGDFVVDGAHTVDRAGSTSAIVVQNAGTFQNAIKFNHYNSGEEQIFQIRQIPAGTRLEITDITNGGVRIAILAPSGLVGIGTNNPVEQLDVAGNIRLTGNIVSPTDICIGNCP